jgi:asparagine synthetase B (glutamine-hydrolysing)
MSSLIGRYSCTGNGKSLHAPEEGRRLVFGRLELLISGVSDTQFVGEAGGFQFAVVGHGYNHDRRQSLTVSDWARILGKQEPSLADADGHFLAVRVKDNCVEIFCDELGLRSAYVREVEEVVYFASRLDLLAAQSGALALNFDRFGSHWLAANQLSLDPLCVDIQRLPPGCKLTIRPDGLKTEAINWPKTATTLSLNGALRMAGSMGRSTTLGLSGGLDSRTLLASCLASLENDHRLSAQSDTSERPDFSCFVFGDEQNPDVAMATRLIRETGLSLIHIRESVPDTDACIRLARAFCQSNNAIATASSGPRLSNYAELHERGLQIVDGGFGEIGRRQFLNRAYYRLVRDGRDGPLRLSDFSFDRPGLFNADTMQLMLAGFTADIEKLSYSSATATRLDIANLLDGIAVRFRLPNFYGYEQSRIDAFAVCRMPFADRNFINSFMAAPLDERIHGRAYRRVIRSNAPSLARFPLVKGSTHYPFRMSGLSAAVWTRVVSRFRRRRFVDNWRREFLLNLEEYVRDLQHSSSVRSYVHYDVEWLDRTIERAYAASRSANAPDAGAQRDLDWWLSFEFFRQGLEDTRRTQKTPTL